MGKRLPKTEPEQKKRRLSRILRSSQIFDVFWSDFDATGTRNVHEIVRKTQRAQAGSEKRCFDCARASGSRVRPFRKPQKTQQEM